MPEFGTSYTSINPSARHSIFQRLCDSEGMISHREVDLDHPAARFGPGRTYISVLNHLRALSNHPPYTGEPFPCTGSAHLAHEHFICTSPAHAPVVES